MKLTSISYNSGSLEVSCTQKFNSEQEALKYMLTLLADKSVSVSSTLDTVQKCTEPTPAKTSTAFPPQQLDLKSDENSWLVTDKPTIPAPAPSEPPPPPVQTKRGRPRKEAITEASGEVTPEPTRSYEVLDEAVGTIEIAQAGGKFIASKDGVNSAISLTEETAIVSLKSKLPPVPPPASVPPAPIFTPAGPPLPPELAQAMNFKAIAEYFISQGYKTAEALLEQCQKYRHAPALLTISEKDLPDRVQRSIMVLVRN